MGYKTLVIIDNSSYLTTLNREIVKETVKYILKNAPKETSIAIAVTGENAEYLCEYDDSLATKLRTVEEISFVDINAPLTDALMDVVLDWKNDDLAMRDIIAVSGSNITYNADYTLEELFFEISGKEYPVYTLTCGQDTNASAVKTLASISRISGAASFDVSEATEEADVEKQLGDKLLAAVSETRKMREKALESNENLDEEEAAAGGNAAGKTGKNAADKYAADAGAGTSDDSESINSIDSYDSDNTAVTEDVESEINNAANEIKVDKQSNMIYQLPDKSAGYKNFVFPIVIITTIATVIYLIFKRKASRDRYEDEKYYKRVVSPDSANIDISGRLPFEGVENMTNITTNLDSFSDESEDTGTRLLYQSRDGVEITLEDRANPTKYFRLCVTDSVVIGRNPKFCDVVIDYDDSVSSKHCEFYLRGDSVYVRDLNSSNGTTINQQKIYQEVRLESGDVLRIGRLSFFVQILGGVNG